MINIDFLIDALRNSIQDKELYVKDTPETREFVRALMIMTDNDHYSEDILLVRGNIAINTEWIENAVLILLKQSCNP